MGLTPAQQNAIDVRDRTLLISAAAGSGKTFTLTQRVIKSIIEDNQDLSRLLIVTFTKAAAGQLKDKVSRAIANAIETNQNNDELDSERKQEIQEHLQNQLIKLGSANISTIDSFFMDPVRANFEKLGLPSSIRMADDAELWPIREKLMREVLDETFDSFRAYEDGTISDVGYSDLYTQLIGIISETRDSSKLIPTLYDIYSKLLTSSKGVENLKDHAQRLSENANKPFFDTKEGAFLKQHLCTVTEYAVKTMDDVYNSVCADPAFTDNAIGFLQGNADTCRHLNFVANNGTIDEVVAEFEAFDFGRFSPKDCEPCEKLEKIKAMRSSINKLLQDTRKKYLFSNQDKISRDFRLSSQIASLTYDILIKFHHKYNEEKLNRGVCDFADMPLYMIKLLRNEDGSYTEYADQLAQSFDAVYIDEYQDVNEIQNDIFTIVGRDHRFMVGDIKQSIYAFREAEPSIFKNYKHSFKEYQKGDPRPASNSGNTIFMSENFRCDPSVIDFTNLICTPLFGTFAESIEYTPKDNLNLAKDLPENYKGHKVILNLIQPTEDEPSDEDDDNSSNEDNGNSDNAKNLSDEAIVVANEIARLHREESVEFGDIKILAMSNKHVKPLLSALSALNIKYSLSSKTELFESPEMKLLVSLLESINNPHFDFPLCHLMTSGTNDFDPLFSFKDVLIIKRHAKKEDSLYDAVTDYSSRDDELAQKCKSFTELINSLRIEAGKMAADKLIKNISFRNEFNELAQSTAYTYLYDCVCKYVKSNWNSLHSFLEYFKKLMESGDVGGEPNKAQKDSVTVMTIHKSKGLEAKVCFLFGFGKQFNIGENGNLVYDREFGPSMKLPPEFTEDFSDLDKIKIKHENTLLRSIFSFAAKSKKIEEEARILYVALTRAEQRLYISATLSRKPFVDYFSNLKDCIDVNYKIKNSNKFIDWILLALPDAEQNDLYSINVFDKGKSKLTSPLNDKENQSLKDTDKIDENEKEFAKLYSSPSNQDANETLLSMIPSKIAASKAAPDMLDKSVFIPLPQSRHTVECDEQAGETGCESEKMIRGRIELMRSSKTDFNSLLDADKSPTAAEKGTAAHQFLQFCDYSRIKAHGVEGEIEFLREKHFISNRTADIVTKSKTKIASFFQSDIYTKALNAAKVHRELHFRMFRPAEDFTTDEDVKRTVSGKEIFVQGSIDLVIETNDGELVLCDYKTDRVSPELQADRNALIEEMRKRHGHQLEQYRYASEKIFGKVPDKIVLFLLSVGECIEV